MHKLESVLENEMHKILIDFEIQTDHLILTSRPDLEIINKKKNLPYNGFCSPSELIGENQRKQKQKHA